MSYWEHLKWVSVFIRSLHKNTQAAFPGWGAARGSPARMASKGPLRAAAPKPGTHDGRGQEVESEAAGLEQQGSAWISQSQQQRLPRRLGHSPGYSDSGTSFG